jgi:hypothetical protein
MEVARLEVLVNAVQPDLGVGVGEMQVVVVVFFCGTPGLELQAPVKMPPGLPKELGQGRVPEEQMPKCMPCLSDPVLVLTC